MKYNYVILGSCDDYYKVAYSELDKYPNVCSIMDYLESNSNFIKTLFRLHTSIKLNNIIDLPLKKIWYPYIFRNDFKEDKPLCVIIFARNALFSNDYVKYLRANYDGCKIVVFWLDLVKTDSRKNIVNNIKEVDLSFTFDQKDAEIYHMMYYPSVYSPVESLIGCKDMESDVYFVGKAKDRLNIILQSYEKFRIDGLKCNFYITGVPKRNRLYKDEIHYCDGISYLDNLKNVQSTKCLLEIMQGGGYGYTLRCAEAMMYNKRIITNNPEIHKANFYDPRFIYQFSDPTKIDSSFVLNSEPVVFPQKDNLLPSKFLEYIDKILCTNE